MRLIDADKLILQLNDYALQESYDNEDCKAIHECIKAVEEAPTAYNVDAVKKKLKSEYKDAKEAYEEYGEERLYGEMIAYKDAIKILENEGNKND